MIYAGWRALIDADARMLWRDPLLGWVLGLPLVLALVLRILVLRGGEAPLTATGFDLAPYHRLIMGGYLMTAPGIVGLVVGFLLLDERDARTLTALRVTPLSPHEYMVYRAALPLVGGTAATLIGYPLVGISPLPVLTLMAIACVASFSAPLVALVLGAAAPNKVAGLAVVKVLNGINLVPIAAFFVPLPLQLFAGVLPTYWPMRALWSAAEHDRYAAYLVCGTAVNACAVLIAAWFFDRRLHRRG
jgi:fluoroquinolone transport system permease protein